MIRYNKGLNNSTLTQISKSLGSNCSWHGRRFLVLFFRVIENLLSIAWYQISDARNEEIQLNVNVLITK